MLSYESARFLLTIELPSYPVPRLSIRETLIAIICVPWSAFDVEALLDIT